MAERVSQSHSITLGGGVGPQNFRFDDYCIVPPETRVFRVVVYLDRARTPKYVCKIAICLIWIVSLVTAVPIAIALRVFELEETLICKY